ncbi:MAG: hypothetical protein PVI88_02355 [Nitrosopumilaceae archaeon]|jgi:hypothetical protein
MNCQSVNLNEYYLYQKKCNSILKEPEIRFAGFLDRMGNLVAGDFKEGVVPLNDELERRKLHLETVLREKMQHEFNYDLGSVEYTATRRKKVITFTLEIGNKILFVSTFPDNDIEKTASKILRICEI